MIIKIDFIQATLRDLHLIIMNTAVALIHFDFTYMYMLYLYNSTIMINTCLLF